MRRIKVCNFNVIINWALANQINRSLNCNRGLNDMMNSMLSLPLPLTMTCKVLVILKPNSQLLLKQLFSSDILSKQRVRIISKWIF
jgi:hypothetical protein